MSENMHIEIFPKETWFSQEKNNFQRSTRPRATISISSLFWQAGITEKAGCFSHTPSVWNYKGVFCFIRIRFSPTITPTIHNSCDIISILLGLYGYDFLWHGDTLIEQVSVEALS